MISPDKTDKELVEAMKESLERDGALSRLRAELRYNLMSKMVHREMNDKKGKDSLPVPPKEVALLNEMIKEYLDFMGYKFSASVFEEESQVSKSSVGRAKTAAALGLKNIDRKSAPVLCCAVETCKKLRQTGRAKDGEGNG